MEVEWTLKKKHLGLQVTENSSGQHKQSEEYPERLPGSLMKRQGRVEPSSSKKSKKLGISGTSSCRLPMIVNVNIVQSLCPLIQEYQEREPALAWDRYLPLVH